MGKLTIYGDAKSGNCLKVKWVADYHGAEYSWREIDVLDHETRTDGFLSINPAGQVPAVVLPNGKSLAQSNAIILYLDGEQGGALSPKDDYERARMFEWLFWEQYSHEPAIAVRRFQKRYLGKADDDIDPALRQKGDAALARMEAALTTPFLVGDKLSLADVALLAYTRLAPEGGFDLAPYPNIRVWIRRCESGLSLDPVPAPASEATHVSL